MKTRHAAIGAAVLLAAGTVSVQPQEWTRFRGPNGTGIAFTRSIPTKITASDINWKIRLPGKGHSSPVVWGEQIFLTCTDDRTNGISVLSLSTADGSLKWRHDFPLAASPRHRFNSPASSTPAVDRDRLYFLRDEPGHYFLTALDHKGNVLWERDFGPFVSQHGSGISPMVYLDKVIVGGEQDDASAIPGGTRTGESFIAAVDAATGGVLWRTARRSQVVAYSTPCLYTPANTPPALIFNSQAHGIYAVDPDDGHVLWEYDQAFDKRSVSSPVVAGDIILGSCGSGGGGNFVTAVRAGDPASGRPPALAYQMKKSAPYVPTSIVMGRLAWLWSDGGIVTCLDAATGTVHYQERVGGNFFGSPVWIDSRIFCVSTSGEIVVLAATDEFNVLHRFKLDELCHATPAVALGHLFVRTESHLVSIGGTD